MKYFSKADENGTNIVNHSEKNIISLSELKNIIKNTGLVMDKIYYPMPDYKLTNVIYTDEKPLSKNNLSRNIVYNTEETIKFYQENEVYKEILEDDSEIFKLFVNSYLVEISKEKTQEEQIKFVSFSNIRKPEYRIKTIIENENVYKYAVNNKSKEHIENIKNNIDIMNQIGLKTVDSYNENRIISKYTNSPTVDKIIIKLVKENKTDEAIEIMKQFKKELEKKLEKVDNQNNVFDKYNIEYEQEKIEKMEFVKYGLWDLIFQNCFYIDSQFYFYDQEWKEEKLPINFILYRAIKYYTRIKKYMSEEELYKIMDIRQEDIEIFDELDEKLQLKIRDKEMWEIHTRGMEMIDLKRKELTANHQINILTMENAKNKSLLEEQNKELEELRANLKYVYNSSSWKITKPLRAVLKLGRGKKG